MLYKTTRSKADSYTDYRTLVEDLAPNGGFFVPYRIPQLDDEQLRFIKEKSFGEVVAFVLNLFYTGRITPWDVDCTIGKMPVKISSVDHRIMLVKLWDNPQQSYEYLCSRLYEKLCNEGRLNVPQWTHISIRISVLFGIYSLLHKMQICSFDICLNTGDFSAPMAAWYARHMGLPVGKIICTCDENSPVWDFLHRGELDTAMIDAVSGVERFICATLGFDEVQNFLEVYNQKGIYRISAEQLQILNQNMFVSVVGKKRADSVISSFFAANNVILDPLTAYSYGGLQDYRAKTGESRTTVLLWDSSPIHYFDAVQRATGFNLQEIKKYIDKY